MHACQVHCMPVLGHGYRAMVVACDLQGNCILTEL